MIKLKASFLKLVKIVDPGWQVTANSKWKLGALGSSQHKGFFCIHGLLKSASICFIVDNHCALGIDNGNRRNQRIASICDAKQNKTKEKEKTIAYYFMAILDQTTQELLRNRESLIFLFKYFNEVN